MEVRKRVLSCYIGPVLMYGCDAWTINYTMKNSIEATEMWFYRKILRIPWTSKQTNEEVLKMANDRRKLLTNIRTRQCKFFSISDGLPSTPRGPPHCGVWQPHHWQGRCF